MLKRGLKDCFIGIFTYIAYVIGAGIFGMPYVVSKIGFFYGMILIIIIGIAVLVTHLMIGEIALSCKGSHQLVGYCQKILGNKWRWLMFANIAVWVYGALIAYIIGISSILSSVFGGSDLVYGLIVFFILSLLVYAGIKIFEEVEVFFTVLMVFVLLSISLIGIFNITASNLSYLNPSNLSFLNLIFLPYGVILFALLGESAIPTMRDELSKHKIFLKESILLGGGLVIIIYLLFTMGVVGVTGQSTTQVATVGLNLALGKWSWLFGNLFAIFAMSTSFLALGFALKNTYHTDLKIEKHLSWGLVCVIALLLYLFTRGNIGFAQILGITGSIAGGISGSMLVYMHSKVRLYQERRPEYRIKKSYLMYGLLFLMYFAGIIYTIFDFIF